VTASFLWIIIIILGSIIVIPTGNHFFSTREYIDFITTPQDYNSIFVKLDYSANPIQSVYIVVGCAV